MLPIHIRLAELRTIQKRRPLTKQETIELEQCLDVNVSYCWKMAKFENFFSLAYATKDTVWMHESSARIDELKNY
jgi:hypothetical protein